MFSCVYYVSISSFQLCVGYMWVTWVILVKKSPTSFFRWFWNFLKEGNFFLPVFLIKSLYVIINFSQY